MQIEKYVNQRLGMSQNVVSRNVLSKERILLHTAMKGNLKISFLRQYSSLWFEKIHFSEDVNNLFVHIKATYDFP